MHEFDRRFTATLSGGGKDSSRSAQAHDGWGAGRQGREATYDDGTGVEGPAAVLLRPAVLACDAMKVGWRFWGGVASLWLDLGSSLATGGWGRSARCSPGTPCAPPAVEVGVELSIVSSQPARVDPYLFPGAESLPLEVRWALPAQGAAGLLSEVTFVPSSASARPRLHVVIDDKQHGGTYHGVFIHKATNSCRGNVIVHVGQEVRP